MSAIIETHDLQKVYHLDGLEVPALRGVNLCVEAGEFVALIGTSGSGKSTLMHLLGCLDEATAGSYRLEGKDVNHLSSDERARLRNERIGFVFQNFNLLPRVDALENAALPLFYTGHPENWQARATATLERVGLSHRLHHRPMERSGGERQRVAIARALITSPGLILADEPTGNLDSTTGEEILRLLEGLNHEGHTLFLVTHDSHVAGRADCVVAMQDGQIIDRR